MRVEMNYKKTVISPCVEIMYIHSLIKVKLLNFYHEGPGDWIEKADVVEGLPSKASDSR
jgi:hypothetical protein